MRLYSGAARWPLRYVASAHVAVRSTTTSSGVAEPPKAARNFDFEPVAPLRVSRALAASARELPVNETFLVGHRALRDVPRVAAVWSFLLEEFQRLDRPASP